MNSFRASIELFSRDYTQWSGSEYAMVFESSPVNIDNTIQVDKGAHGTVCTDLKYAYKVTNLPRVRSKRRQNLQTLRLALHEAVLWNAISCQYILSARATMIRVRRGRLRSLTYQMDLADHNLVRMRRTITLDQIHRMIQHVSLALVYMHSRGIIHGDVKPGNILRFGDTFKLCDLSISILQQINSSRPLASYYYRPPEVFAGERFTAAGDVWSFAVTVLDCLFGAVFFRDVYSIDVDPVQRLRAFTLSQFVDVDSPVYTVLAQALVFDPVGRADMATLARAPYTKITRHALSAVEQVRSVNLSQIYQSARELLKKHVYDIRDLGWDMSQSHSVLEEVLDFIFLGQYTADLTSKVYHICTLMHFKLFALEWTHSEH